MRWTVTCEKTHKDFEVELISVEGQSYEFEVNGTRIRLSEPQVSAFRIETKELSLSCELWDRQFWRVAKGSEVFRLRPQRPGDQQAGAGGKIQVHMPGRVLKILVKKGDAVEAGQTLAIIEAMKMENEIRAESQGEVAEIFVEEGQSLESGQDLIELQST